MTYSWAKGFEKTLHTLHPNIKLEVQRHIDAFVRAIESHQLPSGLGLKKLDGHIWEFRIDLAHRVLLEWKQNEIMFLLVGNHNTVRKFLKYYR